MLEKEILRLIYQIESSISEATMGLNELRMLVAGKQPEQIDKQSEIIQQSDLWPLAIGESSIVSETDSINKKLRASQIISIIGPKHGSNILDFGCGDGFLSMELSRISKSVVGYDIKGNHHWQTHLSETKSPNDNLQLTIDKDIVQASAPYDHIILYDVLDHLYSEDPIVVLRWLKLLLAKNGRMFIRTHPWTSRHGGHLFEHGQSLNKAFLHLTMTSEQLSSIDSLEPNLKVTRPLATYGGYFEKAGLSVIHKKPHIQGVDKYIVDNELDNIINNIWNNEINRETAIQIMSNTFIDFTVT